MYIISARKDFWNSNEISDSPDDLIKDVNLETYEATDKTKEDYQELIKGKKVLLLVHGYNNEPYDVMRAYGIIEEKTRSIIQYFDVVVGYSWPGGDDFLDYLPAKNRAAAITNRFKFLLKETMSNCESLGVMSHSMGCRISLMAYERLHSENFPKTVPVRQYLMAAAVDNEVLELEERFYDATTYTDSSYVFHSRHDSVLANAYRFIEWDRALGYSGPENVADISDKTYIVNCKKVIREHGAYKRTSQIYEYIRETLTEAAPSRFSTLPRR